MVIHTITAEKPFQVGSFNIEYVPLAHSILGACGLYIKTQAGNVFHTGDWKIDETPLLGDKIDEKRMEEIGKEGVDCLLCDSTNILATEEIGSETGVREALIRVVKQHKNNRVTITCFASNVARMETIFHVARETGRKIAVIGRSMHKMIDAVSETSYFSNSFKAGLSLIVSDEEAASMPPSKVLLICTGSQGEARSALYRLARGENRVLKFGKHDTVVFSSKVIPGNEVGIRDVQNQLVRNGVGIVTTETEDDIHVSGHPNKASLAKMYNWLKPKSFIPIHGDSVMLYAHLEFAKENGIPECMIAESGDIINARDAQLKKVDHKDVMFNAIDGNDLIPLTSQAIRDRAVMSYNGYVSVSFVLNSNNKLSTAPDVIINGIYIDPENNKKLETMIYQTITNEVANRANNISALKNESENSIRKLISRHFDKKPLVAVHVHKG